MKRISVRTALLLMLVMLAAPATAWAGGPMPPMSVFLAPPTPTPAPLFSPEASTPTPAPAREIPVPSTTTQLYLPFVRADRSLASFALPTTTPDIPKDDPHATSFIYIVKQGDTLSNLAIEFGRDQRTLHCVTRLDGSPITRLQPGQSIIIPALSDLCHTVKTGENLQQIAKWYGVSVESLLKTPQNHLTPQSTLKLGQVILIPNARSRYRDPAELNLPRPRRDGWRYGDGHFIWPVAPDQAWLSQGFQHGKHMAIDLAAPTGTPVRAADTGVVIKAGWNDSGYGYRIVIDHGIDYVTVYAHLSEYYTREGDVVQKGEVIGRIGSTGNSTGPHLHFEVRDYGYLIDPLLVLPKVAEIEKRGE